VVDFDRTVVDFDHTAVDRNCTAIDFDRMTHMGVWGRWRADTRGGTSGHTCEGAEVGEGGAC
jgi:hypothetical protein